MNAALSTLLVRLDAADQAALHPDTLMDTALASRLAVWMIGQALPAPEPADGILDELLGLHRREGRGEAVAAQEWRLARDKASDMSEHAPFPEVGIAPEAALAAGVAEAAAWPLSHGQSGLTELFTTIRPVRGARASAATGWTHEDQAAAETILKALRDSGLDRSQIPGRFSQTAPELSDRFVRQLEASNAAYQAWRGDVLDALRMLSADHAEPRPSSVASGRQ